MSTPHHDPLRSQLEAPLGPKPEGRSFEPKRSPAPSSPTRGRLGSGRPGSAWLGSARLGSARLATGLLATSLVATACGQSDPPPSEETPNYFPLVDGAVYSYAHDNWTEQVTLSAVEVDGEMRYTFSDSPNPGDLLRSDSVMAERDGRVVRLTKEEFLSNADGDVLQSSVTYGVGFTRFNAAWVTEGVGFVETPEYVRVETPAGGSAQAPEDRRHTFEVLAVDEEVTTPVGTFNCVAVRRTKDWQTAGTDTSDAQTKIYWFAPGVGKVREYNESTGSRETLVAVSMPSVD